MKETLFLKDLYIILAYVDNLDIIGRSAQSVVAGFTTLEVAAKNMRLTINVNKTKCIVKPRYKVTYGDRIKVTLYYDIYTEGI